MLAQVQPSILDMIPGARSAVNYLLGKVAEFQRVPQRLTIAQNNLVNVKRIAESKNRFGNAMEAALAIQQVSKLQSDYQKASGSVANALDQLRQSGLLAGPLDVAAAVANASTKVAAILSGTDSVEKTASSLSTRVMSPEEQAATRAPTALGSPIIRYVIIGGLGYMALRALRKGRGTRSW